LGSRAGADRGSKPASRKEEPGSAGAGRLEQQQNPARRGRVVFGGRYAEVHVWKAARFSRRRPGSGIGPHSRPRPAQRRGRWACLLAAAVAPAMASAVVSARGAAVAPAAVAAAVAPAGPAAGTVASAVPAMALAVV